jgi:hypothetical protein
MSGYDSKQCDVSICNSQNVLCRTPRDRCESGTSRYARCCAVPQHHACLLSPLASTAHNMFVNSFICVRARLLTVPLLPLSVPADGLWGTLCLHCPQSCSSYCVRHATPRVPSTKSSSVLLLNRDPAPKHTDLHQNSLKHPTFNI